jgi:hypothetical protein
MRALKWYGLAALALMPLGVAPARAIPSPASGAWLEYVAAVGDSVRYEAHWSPAPVGADQRPLAAYDVQIVLGAQTVLATARTAQVAATLTIARPAPGDSLGPLALRVRSIDTSGAASSWAVTSPWTIHHDALPPSPPVQVRVDSGTVALDSVILRPRIVAMAEGATVHMCPILFPTGGTPGLTPEDAARADCYAEWQTWVASEHPQAA